MKKLIASFVAIVCVLLFNSNLVFATVVPVQVDVSVCDRQYNTALHVGSRGDDVKVLQQILKDGGFLSGRIDGIYGRRTERARQSFELACDNQNSESDDVSVLVGMGTPTTSTTVNSQGEVSSITYTIPVQVTASGGDAFFGQTIQKAVNVSGTNAFSYVFQGAYNSYADSTGGNAAATITSTDNDTGNVFRATEGQRKNFVLSIKLVNPPTSNTSYRVALKSIQFFTNSNLSPESGSSMELLPAVDFRTNSVFINGTSASPSSTPSILSPVAGSHYTQGQSVAVSWQGSGALSNFGLSYSTSANVNDRRAIIMTDASASCTSAGVCVASWTPNVSSSTMKIFVNDKTSGNIGSSEMFAVFAPLESSLSITTSSPLANAKVGTNFSKIIEVAGNDSNHYTWEVSTGSLSPGLTLNPLPCIDSPGSCLGSGIILGTPTTAGTYVFTLKIKSGSSYENIATKQFTLVVDPADVAPVLTPQITLLSPSGGEVWKIGNSKILRWSAQNVPTGGYLQVNLVDGPTPIKILSREVGNGQMDASLTVPANGCVGDVCYPELKPGQYKVKAFLYDSIPCTGQCSNMAKLLAQDSSDGFVTVASNVTTTTPVAMCDYANPASGCTYVKGPNYNATTNCGMVLSCTPVVTAKGTIQGYSVHHVSNSDLRPFPEGSVTVKVTSKDAYGGTLTSSSANPYNFSLKPGTYTVSAERPSGWDWAVTGYTMCASGSCHNGTVTKNSSVQIVVSENSSTDLWWHFGDASAMATVVKDSQKASTWGVIKSLFGF